MHSVLADTRQAKMLVTLLPSFAEVMFYNRGQFPVLVLEEGIVQSSGKALLDAYVRMNLVVVGKVPKDQFYWFIKPGPVSEYHESTD